MKLSRIFPYFRSGGREIGALEPVSLLVIGSSYDIIEIWLSRRLGLISVWEEKITLNDGDRTVYRSEYRPDVIKATDCRGNLAKHLDNNCDLFETDIIERIRWFHSYLGDV